MEQLRLGIENGGRMRRAFCGFACSALLLSAVGCDKPEPPPTERPPEPQAAARVPATPDHAALRRAIDAPQDRARAVEDVTLEAADRRRAEIEAQSGD
jgi:hypothetical protein